jgi:alkanesulfonate monooxygenase SsuD/methylene tetrahydromethanopterin reductase-like flavin-dependent oxidoreductase (luciferase family)
MAGAGSTAAAERAGRLGVGLTLVIFEWDTIRETIETFRTAAGAAGNDPRLPIMLQVNGNVTIQPLDERRPLLGSPEQVAADLDQASKLGVEHVYWNSDDDPPGSSRYWNSCVALIGHAAPRRRCTSADLDPIEAPAASKYRRSYRARAAPPRWQTHLIARQTIGERGRREER